MKFFASVICMYLIIHSQSFAFAIAKPHSPIVANQNVVHSLKASDFIKLSAKEFSVATGRKMNMLNRLSFFLVKMRIKHDLKKHPAIDMQYYVVKAGRKMSAWWWVAIGVVLAFILLLLLAKAALAGLQ